MQELNIGMCHRRTSVEKENTHSECYDVDFIAKRVADMYRIADSWRGAYSSNVKNVVLSKLHSPVTRLICKQQHDQKLRSELSTCSDLL
jgi:hypothetical protein